MTSDRRKCKHDPDVFCFICGGFKSYTQTVTEICRYYLFKKIQSFQIFNFDYFSHATSEVVNDTFWRLFLSLKLKKLTCDCFSEQIVHDGMALLMFLNSSSSSDEVILLFLSSSFLCANQQMFLVISQDAGLCLKLSFNCLWNISAIFFSKTLHALRYHMVY